MGRPVQEGTEWPEAKWYIGSMMLMETQLLDLIRTPFFDSHIYEVEFPGKHTTELAAKIITELMYAQCDINENEYHLLEAFNNHRKNGSALMVQD